MPPAPQSFPLRGTVSVDASLTAYSGNRGDKVVDIERNHLYTLSPRLWRLGFVAASLAWMGMIFYLSSLSKDDADRALESPIVSWLGPLESYAAHLALYGVLASLIQASIRSWKPAAGYQLWWVLAAAAFATLYGVSDEYHQSFVPGRSASIVDVLVDGVGAASAAGGLWLLARSTRRQGADLLSR